MDEYIISELQWIEREMTEIRALNDGLAGEIRSAWRGKDADEFTGRLLLIGESAFGAASQLNVVIQAAQMEMIRQSTPVSL